MKAAAAVSAAIEIEYYASVWFHDGLLRVGD
jgi:hypothetical protein